MLISTKATNLELTLAISRYVNKKLTALGRLVRAQDESAHAEVEIEKTTAHHRSGDVFRAEINLHIAGKRFRAEVTTNDLYAAIDAMKDEIERALESHKDKRLTLRKKGGQKVKSMLHGK